MPEVDRNLYFNNLTGEYEEGYRDPVTHVIQFGSGQPPEATDAALLRASEQSVSLSDVQGTGKEGRVTAKDVDDHVKSLSESAPASEAGQDESASQPSPQPDQSQDSEASGVDPYVQARADERGVNLADVTGSGEGGQVTVQDVENTFHSKRVAGEL